jgi:glucose/arabinose dehydrogenase
VNAIPDVSLEVAFPGLSDNVFGSKPVWMTYPPDGTDRIVVVEQDSEVFILDDDPVTNEMSKFLDIRDRVSRDGREEGLLGLAFHPDFGANGEFFVYYSTSNPRRSVLSRFSVPADTGLLDRAAHDSEEIILEVLYLYVGFGDGGSRGDPRGNGQNAGTLLGLIQLACVLLWFRRYHRLTVLG